MNLRFFNSHGTVFYDNFSSGTVCLSLVSNDYDEADYIYDFDRFKELSRSHEPIF